MCVICVYMNTLMSWSSLFGSNIVLLEFNVVHIGKYGGYAGPYCKRVRLKFQFQTELT